MVGKGYWCQALCLCHETWGRPRHLRRHCCIIAASARCMSEQSPRLLNSHSRDAADDARRGDALSYAVTLSNLPFDLHLYVPSSVVTPYVQGDKRRSREYRRSHPLTWQDYVCKVLERDWLGQPPEQHIEFEHGKSLRATRR